jgi:hypothetical protein
VLRTRFASGRLSVDAISVITTILLIGPVKGSCFLMSEAACARQKRRIKGGRRPVVFNETREAEIDRVIAASPEMKAVRTRPAPLSRVDGAA